MIGEFKKFLLRGNILDLAIGVIIGTAFGKVVSSFVADVLMPPIGMLVGKVDFTNLYLNLSGGDYPSLVEAKKAGAATLNYGLFLGATIDFLITAAAIFLFFKLATRLTTLALKPAQAAASTKACPECCSGVPIAAKRCMYCTSAL